MEAIIHGQVGPQVLSDGSSQAFRQGRNGEQVTQDLHGRFYEQALRGNLYSGGMTGTSISNATFTVATTDATATPIVGLWNPAGSGVNAVLVAAQVSVYITAATATGPGGFVWTACTGNTLTAIGTGIAGWSNNTLLQSGARCRSMAGAALTSKTNALAVFRGAGLGGGALGAFSEVGTAVGFIPMGQPMVEYFNGSVIVPPGGIIALQCVVTPVAHSASSGLVWEEVPI
jgi:hypothetical protein